MRLIELPPSKSLANRTLTALAVRGKALPEPDESWSDDMRAMYRVLQGDGDAGAAGTAFRFGMAYWAANEGASIHLRGSERLLQRPIDGLVDGLRSLGADLSKENDGSWKIHGKKLTGGPLSMDATVSSQFISALYLVEPRMAKKLKLKLEGHVVSAPYIAMTQRVMEDGEWPVEADWSAGIVWALRASCMGESICLQGLGRRSIQGDSIWSRWGLPLGFSASYEAQGLVIRGLPSRPKEDMHLDLKDCPDLAQPIAAAGVLMRRKVHLTGLETLNGKEIPRLDALKAAMSSLGISVEAGESSELIFDSSSWNPSEVILSVDPEEDHRMAFFWALIGLEQPTEWTGEATVSKSYPHFWSDWNE
ncbi:hypothetical protein N9N00_01995 [Schleiferiaceae bacterium]|jgi:3-phosphoshikimate 1-carboxyvinyltransferase|nr:hypothetical protein [Schleiferiaceae bacterium]